MTPKQIEDRLLAAFPGDLIQVTDLTGTEDHYEVEVTSQKFHGLTRIQMHQMVMAVFSPELKTGELHALSIKTKKKE